MENRTSHTRKPSAFSSFFSSLKSFSFFRVYLNAAPDDESAAHDVGLFCELYLFCGPERALSVTLVCIVDCRSSVLFCGLASTFSNVGLLCDCGYSVLFCGMERALCQSAQFKMHTPSLLLIEHTEELSV